MPNRERLSESSQGPVPYIDINELFAKHGRSPGGEFVGPSAARRVPDYEGPIVTVADSRLGQDRSARERASRDQLRALIQTDEPE